MKNREKYPKTEDAIKAFNERLEKSPLLKALGMTFDEWLNLEAKEDRPKDDDKTRRPPIEAVLGMAIACALHETIGDKLKEGADIGDDLGKCPVCGGAVKLETTIVDTIDCPDCGMHFGMNKGNSDKDHRERLLANWRKLQENVKK